MAPAVPPPPPAPPGQILFTLPIAPYSSATAQSSGGSFTLSLLKPSIYLLTFYSPPDNRLTPQFCDTFRLALSILQHSPTSYPPGVLLTTSSAAKFYSNGLDWASAVASPTFMADHLYPLWRKLVTFPMPTVAVINGHAFAGGLMTAMAHDYRFMNPHKGYLCVNELEFNVQLLPAMSTLFKVKLPTVGTTFRTMALEAKRFNALAALEAGIIDGIGGIDEAMKVMSESGIVAKMGAKKRGETSYGKIKEELYRDVIADLDLGTDGENRVVQAKDIRRKKKEDEEQKAVLDWMRTASPKAKL